MKLKRLPLTLSILLLFATVAMAQSAIDNSLPANGVPVVSKAPPQILGARATSGSDDFNRPDGTNMGPDWTEVMSDFWIGNNQGYALSSGYMLSTSVAAPYAGSTCSLDFFHSPYTPTLVYTALIAAAGSDFLFVKVQDNNSDGYYDRVFFYKNFNGGKWGSATYYFDLATTTTSGRMTLSFDNTGDVATLDIDNNFDGIIDETFSCPGILSAGLALGQGFGIATYHNESSFDNWSVNEGGVTLEASGNVISEAVGGQIKFKLGAGAANAGRNYLIFANVTGTSPGFMPPPGLITIPINWDVFTSLAISLTNTTIFQNFYGTLDANGNASAMFDTLGPFTGGAGLIMNFAFACDLNTVWDVVSNPVSVKVTP